MRGMKIIPESHDPVLICVAKRQNLFDQIVRILHTDLCATIYTKCITLCFSMCDGLSRTCDSCKHKLELLFLVLDMLEYGREELRNSDFVHIYGIFWFSMQVCLLGRFLQDFNPY